MKFAYIDESGVIKGNSNYFNISLLIVNNEKDLKRLKHAVKRFRKGKYKKQMKNVKEIKAYNIDYGIVEDLLNILNQMEIKIYSIFYDNKKNILKNNDRNEIYHYLVLELLKQAKLDNTRVDLAIDKFLPKKLENVFKNDIMKLLNNKKSNVYCVQSESNIGIQIVDLISWSTFQYLDRNNKLYLQIIKDKCILTEFNKKNK
ncbi:MAG: DUF3800 domain-containing protein [Methanobrevibacter sp.]|nr:DUF3800 domain-containing protein [Methanobrevibacter sp.]